MFGKGRHRRRAALLCVAALVPLFTAACNGSSASSDDEYVIGNIGTFSGAYASSNIGAKYALDAWVRNTNAKGGINGRKIKLIQKDDQLNAALALREVRDMITRDHVMALVGVSSIVEDAWAEYASGQGIPVIGDDLAKDVMEKHKNFFPQGAVQSTGYFYGVPAVAKLLGRTRFGAIYCAESTACSQIANSQKDQASAAGVNFVFSAAVKSAAPSYTAQCLAAKASGATSVVLLLNTQVAGRVAAACEQQGFHPQWLQAATGFSQGETSIAALDGSAGTLPTFPWFATDTPAQQAFQDAMHKYEPDAFKPGSNGYGAAAAGAWAAAEIFGTAAKTLAKDKDTGKDLIQALYNLPKNNTFGGLTPPISYSDTGGPQQPVKCFFAIQLKSGTFTTLNGGKPLCKS